jgi:beta-lactam-binding protein with PASTA domain
MDIRRGSAARVALALTCVFAAMGAVQERRFPRKMPDVRWLDYETAQARIRQAAGRAANEAGSTRELVIVQSPEPGADVLPNTPLAITLGKPKVRLEVSTTVPKPNEEVRFAVAFDPPAPPTKLAIEYRYMWGDRSPQTVGASVVTHRFATGQYRVTAYAVIGRRWQTEPASTTISVANPPQRFRERFPATTTLQPAPVPSQEAPQPRPMPDVQWLDYNTAEARIERAVGRVAKGAGDFGGLVIVQSPEPSADVLPKTPLTITLGKPKLLYKISTTTPNVNEDVRLALGFDPPPPRSHPPIEYHYAWGDGGEDTLTTPLATHRFSEGLQYVVTAYAVIGGRWQTDRVSVSITVTPPPPRRMPDVRWFDYRTAEVTIQEAVGRGAKAAGDSRELVIAQSPEPGADVLPKAPLTITLGKPTLQLTVSNPAPKANEDVEIKLAFDPLPPPSHPPIEYHYAWGDDKQDTLATPVATHSFTEGRRYVVTAYAVIGGRWQTEPVSTSISVTPPPPRKMPDVRWLDSQTAQAKIQEAVGRVATPSGNSQDVVLAQNPAPGDDVDPNTAMTLTLGRPTLRLSLSNAAPKPNDTVSLALSVDPPAPSGSTIRYDVVWGDGQKESLTSSSVDHAFANAGAFKVTADAVVGGRWQTDPVSTSISVVAPTATEGTGGTTTTTSGTTTEGGDSQPTPLQTWLIALLVAVAVIVIGLIARALRGSKTPVAASAGPSISFGHGMGNCTYTIENAEELRGGVNVRLRSGVRAVEILKGGSDV